MAEGKVRSGRLARGDGFSEERRTLFLAALRRGESVLGACALVGISNRTAYNHRRRDPAFARAWELARQMAWMPLELAAYERAVPGIEEPVYAYGRLSHRRVRRSDALLRMLLVAEKPKKYGRAAGLRSERKRLEKRLDRRLAEAIEPLREELEALRALRNSGPKAVNFMNPQTTPSALRNRRESRGNWRLAAARRRHSRSEISQLPGSS